MCEMLANQYFMTQKFSEALTIYEKIVKEHPSEISIQAKLIICLTATGHLNRALDLFSNALNKNAEFIINKDFETEICPCKDLIEKINKGELETTLYRKLVALGILWLYCDVEQSLNNFTQAYNIDNNVAVFDIISKISKLIKPKNQLWS